MRWHRWKRKANARKTTDSPNDSPQYCMDYRPDRYADGGVLCGGGAGQVVERTVGNDCPGAATSSTDVVSYMTGGPAPGPATCYQEFKNGVKVSWPARGNTCFTEDMWKGLKE